MLKSQYRGGYQNGHLFAVGYGFKGSAHGNFGFAKPYVATNKAVHGFVAFHVAFYQNGGFGLVGGIFV